MPDIDTGGQSPPLILHVIHHLHMGGMENGLVNLINSMPEDRYRHGIVCIEDDSPFRKRIRRPGVEVYCMHRSRVGIWGLRRDIYELCRKLQPAIVHSRNMSGLDAIVPAMLAGVRRRVHSEHGWDVDDPRGERFKPALLRKLHSPFVTRYITVSGDLARYLEHRVGIAPSRITHICNGVDTLRFAPGTGAQRRSALPESLRDDNLVLIGTVGRLQPIKNQPLLLHAFAAAVNAHPPLRARARLAVVGGGPLLAELRDLANTLGIADETWLPGARDDVPEILRALDVFALTSHNEGISNTILEALASGLPVVATNVGGNPELVDDGVTGRLFASGDVTSLTNTIADYALNDKRRLLHGKAARSTALERFSLTAMINRYQAVYGGLMDPETRG